MVMQAFLAAVSDLALYRLAFRFCCASGSTPSALNARWALLCLCTSWFHTFCAPRTLLNSLECQLAVLALLYYPAWAHSSSCTCGPPFVPIVAAPEPDADSTQATGPEHSSRPVTPDLRSDAATSGTLPTGFSSLSALGARASHLVRRFIRTPGRPDGANSFASPAEAHANECATVSASATSAAYLRPHPLFTLIVALLLLLRPTSVTFLALLGAHHLYVTRVRHWPRLALDYASVALPVFALSLLADYSFYGRLTLPCDTLPVPVPSHPPSPSFSRSRSALCNALLIAARRTRSSTRNASISAAELYSFMTQTARSNRRNETR